jgi:isopenicillin N synthase-like dioxygenase
MKQSIPVVNLEQFRSGDEAQQSSFVTQLGQALEKFGFVAIENHGVSMEALDKGYAHSRELFLLDEVTKKQYEHPEDGCQRGYTSMGREHAKGRTAGDIKEFWHVGPELPTLHPLYNRVRKNIWAHELHGFKQDMLALWNELNECGRCIMMALARYLDEDEHQFSTMIDGGDTILRSIRYPGPDEVKPKPGAVWAAEHEDINLITLLPSSKERGLELLRKDGSWMPIEPVPGQLIADTGDMFERLTNGRFPSTTHRVMAPKDADGPRYSMPFFMHPHPDYNLRSVDSCISDEHPRKWEDVTAAEFLRIRLLEIGVLEEE